MSQEPEATFHGSAQSSQLPASNALNLPLNQPQLSSVLPLDLLQPRLRSFIIKRRPEIEKLGFVTLDDLLILHNHWLNARLEREVDKIEGESEDPEDLKHPEMPNIYSDFGHKATFGERIADKMARIGGSWAFIVGFLIFLAAWIVTNVALLASKPFDPYPFILLNLALSMVAALQAPVIMMSQNRQERMDRLRSEHDFRINLRAELELRSLHAKIDRLMAHQWERMQEHPGQAAAPTRSL